MDRRSFLKTSGAVAASAGVAAPAGEALATPALGSGIRELAVAVAWPDAIAGPHDDARRLLHRLATATEGRYAFRVVSVDPTGALPLDIVARGQADLYFASDSEHVAVDPAFAWFAGLPGALGLAPDDHEAWLLAAGGQMLWDDLAAEHGVKPLLAGHLGHPAGLWSETPITAPGDLAGRLIAADGLNLDVARGLGAETAVVRPGRIATTLVSAAQGHGLATDLALGLPRPGWRYYTAGLAPSGATLTLGIALQTWDAMPASDRAVVAGFATMAWRESVAAVRLHCPLALAALRNIHGIEPEPLPVDITRHIDRVSEAVVAHAASTSGRAGAISSSLSAYFDLVGRNHFARPIG